MRSEHAPPDDFAALAAAALSVSACANTDDLAQVPEPMGRFLLGHTVTVVEEPEIGPFSREATDEAWETAINFAMEERFGRWDGDKYFHIATKVDGYALAMIGVPVVFTPKSVLIASVTIWDDERARRSRTIPRSSPCPKNCRPRL